MNNKELLRALKPFFTTQEREKREICFYLEELEKLVNEIYSQQELIKHIKAYAKQIDNLIPNELKKEIKKSLDKGEVIYAKVDILLTKAIYNKNVYRFCKENPKVFNNREMKNLFL